MKRDSSPVEVKSTKVKKRMRPRKKPSMFVKADECQKKMASLAKNAPPSSQFRESSKSYKKAKRRLSTKSLSVIDDVS